MYLVKFSDLMRIMLLMYCILMNVYNIVFEIKVFVYYIYLHFILLFLQLALALFIHILNISFRRYINE